MTKDDMKNRISMTLKDPVLQQGFKIICKENAELKAYKDQVDEAKVLIRRLINACCSYGATGKTTADAEAFLEKE